MNLVGVGQWDLDAIKLAILEGLSRNASVDGLVALQKDDGSLVALRKNGILAATQTNSVLEERSRVVIPVDWKDPVDQMISDDIGLLTHTLVADEAFISKVEENLKSVGWWLEIDWVAGEDIWELFFVICKEIEKQDN